MKLNMGQKVTIGFSIMILFILIMGISTVISTNYTTIIVGLIAILFGIGLCFIITRSINKAISTLTTESNRLTESVNAGKLDIRGNMEKVNFEFQGIIRGMNGILDDVSGPLNMAAEYIERISKGDTPPKITDDYNGDFNEIKNNLNTLIDEIGVIVDEVGVVINAGLEGKLDQRADADKLEGVWRKIIRGMNDTLDAVIGPLNMAAEYVDRISKGDIPPKITDDYNGDFNEIKNNLNGCIDAISDLLLEAQNLVLAVREGRLDTRGDVAAFAGDWGKLIGGMNGLIEAIAEPVGEMRTILARMAVLDLNEKIDQEYLGVWNDLKDDINKVNELLMEIVNISENISNGNLRDLAMLKQVGQRSDNDRLTPTYVQMMEAIQNLVVEANDLAQAAVEGRLDTRADASKHDGDFRKIIEGMNATLDAVINPLQEAITCLKEMAEGNLDIAVIGDYQGDHAMIKDALNKTLEEINDILGQITIAIEQVNTGALQVSDSSQSLSQGAVESASTMDQLTSSMSEMNSQTKQNAENAMQANQLATQARGVAEKGNEQMTQMVKAMGDINESSTNISKIIKVIDDIAFQTNILALNAAVEAARAGKHGKGFTVVAEEVRNLAQRSADAAKETAEMIEGSIKKTEAGAKIADETSSALEEIVLGTAKVTDLIGEIAAASKEQSVGIGQINEGLNQVDQVTQQTSAGSVELAAASEEMSSQSAMVKEMLGKFKLKKQSHLDARTSYMSNAAPQRTVHKQTRIGENKPNTAGVQEVAATKEPRLSPEDIKSLNDTEFGNF